MQEIEKKFLIKSLPENLENYKKIHIEQGYLNNTSTPTLRIRKYGEEYILCYKSKIKSEKNIASIAEEIELPLTKEAYNDLASKIEGRLIEKDRYLVPLYDNLVAEIDIFQGFLKGLKMVEVEFPSEQMAEKFIIPEWFGKDVSLDKKYKNAHLCGISDISDLLK